MSDGPEPGGRLGGATLSVGVADTVSMEDTGASADLSVDFTELREVDRANYAIGDEIARGGMGVIYEARDRRTGRTLAIKEARPAGTADPAAVRAAVLRFHREAVLTAQLQHPSIVPVYEIGRFDQTPFIAMKLVRGTPLDRVFDACETAADRLALLPKVIDVAEAIAYAHSEGVVHRDLKPANVIAGDFGETIVIDWGLAKGGAAGDDDISLAAAGLDDVETVAGAVFGTPRYMSPEQAAGEEIGPRADVYALGAILYELLAGEAPYTSDLEESGKQASAEDVVNLVTERAPRAIAELNHEAPSDLVSIAEKAMARDPASRYASAAELAADLWAFQRGQLVEVHDYSAFDLIRRWLGRRRALVLTAAILLLAGAASTTWFVIQTREQERRASAELDRAMRTLRDRGFDELARGNLQRAAVALATAYQHLDDEPLRIALAEVMSMIDPFTRELYRSPSRLGDIAVDRSSGRVAIESGDTSKVIDLDGNTLFEVEGSSPEFTGGGAMLVTQRGDRLLIWSTRDGSRLQELDTGPLDSWSVLAGMPRLVYVAGGDVVVVSPGDGAELARAALGPAALFARVILSPRGRYVAISSEQARVLEVATGELRVLGPMRSVGYRAMSFSPDGSLLAVSPQPGQIFVVAPATGAIEQRYSEHGRPIAALAFTGDRRHVVSLDVDGGLCFRDLDRSRARCDLTARAAHAHVFGDEVFSGHFNGTVRAWDIHGQVVARLAAHADGPTFAIPIGDGRVISGGDDGALRLWTLGDRRDWLLAGGHDETIDVASPLVFRRRGGELRWLDPRRPDRVTSIRLADYHRPSVDRAGATIAVGGAVYDRAGRPIAALATSDIRGFALHPNGTSAASCNEAGVLSLIALPGGHTRWTADLSRYGGPGTFREIEFSPTGAQLLVGLPGADVVLDAATGEQLASIVLGGRSSAQVVLRGDSRYVSAENNRVILWSAIGEIASLELPGRVAIAANPGGAHVVVGAGTRIGIFGAGDSDAITWLGRGRQTESPITAIATSPRGLIAASASDGRIYVYSSDGQLLATRQVGLVNRMSFIDDQQLLIGGPGLARLWSLAPERRDPIAINARIAALLSAP